MAKNDETKPAEAAAAGGAPAADNAESRIAEQRLRDLQEQAAKAVGEAQAAKAEALALRGDLERANTELAGLKASNERLSSANQQLVESSTARDGLPGLPIDLPKGAFQLVESVTIAAVGDDGKPVRANAKRGDVVVVGPKGAIAELQTELGLVARAYAITRDTADELRAIKAIR
jgi:hypothetical protein